MSLIYSFDVRIAEKFGVEEAILLNAFSYWSKLSINEIVNIFPFFEEKKINSIIDSLKKKGILIDESSQYSLNKEVEVIL